MNEGNPNWQRIRDKNGDEVALLAYNGAVDAPFIVKAVNLHSELVEALKFFNDCLRLVDEGKPMPVNWMRTKVNELLAKASNDGPNKGLCEGEGK